MKKVLHINSYYKGSPFYRDMFDKMLENKEKFVVYTPIQNGTSDDFDYREYTVVSETFNKNDKFFFKRKQRKIIKDLKRKIDLSEISLIHSHTLFTNGYSALKLYEEYGIPYVISIRNTDINVFFRRAKHLRKIGLKILKNAESIIYISKTAQEEVEKKYIPNNLIKSFANKSTVIGNGLSDFWLLQKTSPRLQIDKDEKVKFLFVGDINLNKNILSVLKALQKLIDSGYKVKLDIIGSPIDKTIVNSISKYSFATYHGRKNKPELLKFYQSSHIFIMPSITETFGISYLEALVQNTPVIYSLGQGFDGVFDNDRFGYGVQPDCIEDIESKSIQAINNYNDFESSSEFVRTNYNWHTISKRITDLYNLESEK